MSSGTAGEFEGIIRTAQRRESAEKALEEPLDELYSDACTGVRITILMY